jgi:Ca2+-binding EF-hand superfamily protein
MAPPRGLQVEIPGGGSRPGTRESARSPKRSGEQASVASREGTSRAVPAGVALLLTGKERHAREVEAIFHVIRETMKSQRTIFGHQADTARKAFRAIDRDGNGSIDREEFGAAVLRLGLGLGSEQVDTLMQAMDLDKDATIEYEEFLRLLGLEFDQSAEAEAADAAREEAKSSRQSTRREANTKRFFAHNALDHDQKTQRQEDAIFRVLRQKMKAHVSLFGHKIDGGIEGFFEAVDQDANGNVDKAEFASVLARLDLGLTDQQFEDVIAGVDENSDGQINFEEFLLKVRAPRAALGLRPSFHSGHDEDSSSDDGGEHATRVPVPPSRPQTRADKQRAEFEKDMGTVNSVLSGQSSSRREHVESLVPAFNALTFSLSRTRQSATDLQQRAPGATLVPWPPRAEEPPDAWYAAPKNLVEQARSTFTPPSSAVRLGSSSARFAPLSPRQGGAGRAPLSTRGGLQSAGSLASTVSGGFNGEPERPLWNRREFGADPPPTRQSLHRSARARADWHLHTTAKYATRRLTADAVVWSREKCAFFRRSGHQPGTGACGALLRCVAGPSHKEAGGSRGTSGLDRVRGEGLEEGNFRLSHSHVSVRACVLLPPVSTSISRLTEVHPLAPLACSQGERRR